MTILSMPVGSRGATFFGGVMSAFRMLLRTCRGSSPGKSLLPVKTSQSTTPVAKTSVCRVTFP